MGRKESSQECYDGRARKGAVTDVLKSAPRGYGEQFGKSLYGDGTKTQQASRPATVRAVETHPGILRAFEP